MKTNSLLRTLIVSASVCLVLTLQTGCMTVQHGNTVVQNFSNKQVFNGKKIAVLPVKTQTALATDSIQGLRQEVNKRLGQVLKSRLSASTVLDVATVAEELNQKNLLPAYEQFIATYENTGVLDRKQIKALAQGLGSDFLLFTRLKAEKMDILISRGFGSSIDTMLIDARTGEVMWSGTGEWKRGGIFGAGEAKLDEAAGRLLDLAFASL